MILLTRAAFSFAFLSVSFAEVSEEVFSVVCESLTEVEASEAFTAVFLSELSEDERSRPAIPLTATIATNITTTAIIPRISLL